MNALTSNRKWLATGAAVLAVTLFLGFQRTSAQVGRNDALRSVGKVSSAAIGVQGTGGSGNLIMDGDWFYVLHGNRLYKIQKSTMSVFQTTDLN